jgi:ABC-type uncharacterized transport system permease subunit
MMNSKLIKIIKNPFVTALIAVVMGLAIGAIIIAIAGYDPFSAYSSLYKGIFSKPRYIMNIIIKAIPIMLTGLSVAFAFKTGLFNIGAEGQYIIGAIAAAIVGYMVDLPSIIHIPLVIIVAMLASGAWGGLAGYLKAKCGINEVITTIMLNWIALYLQNFLITMPWLKKPGAEASYEVLDSARISVLGKWKFTEEGLAWINEHPNIGEVLLKTDVNWGIVIALIVVMLVWFILRKTTLGYSLRAVGLNTDAAEFAGIKVKRSIVVSMFIAGAIAGLAGCINVIGANPFRISTLSMMEGYGFDGISVALIANSSPVGCVFSSLVFAGLRYGGQSIQRDLGIPSEIINIMIGTIVFFVAISTITNIVIDRVEKRRKKKS